MAIGGRDNGDVVDDGTMMVVFGLAWDGDGLLGIFIGRTSTFELTKDHTTLVRLNLGGGWGGNSIINQHLPAIIDGRCCSWTRFSHHILP